MSIVPTYAALLALLFVALSIRTLRLRRRLRIAIGDAGDPALLRAMRVHSNFAEYAPLSVILLSFLELRSAPAALVHGLCLCLLIGRSLHAFGVSRTHEDYRFRIAGMALTFMALSSFHPPTSSSPLPEVMAPSEVLLEGAVWSAHALTRRVPSAAPATKGLGGSAWEGLPRVLASPYLAGIAGYALCAACLATFVYLQQAGIVKAALPDRGARTAFFANVELITGLATIVLQLLVTSRLLRWLGVGVVLAILPVVQGVGVLALVMAPSLAMATAVSASGRAATHALSRPSRELLFTALPRDDKYRAKNVIDTLVYRFGDFGSAWLHRGLAAVGVVVAAVAVPLAAAWVALAVALGIGHRRRTRDDLPR